MAHLCFVRFIPGSVHLERIKGGVEELIKGVFVSLPTSVMKYRDDEVAETRLVANFNEVKGSRLLSVDVPDDTWLFRRRTCGEKSVFEIVVSRHGST